MAEVSKGPFWNADPRSSTDDRVYQIEMEGLAFNKIS